MSHPLDQCRLKLGRARYHLVSLQEAVQRFIEGKPYGIGRYLEADGAEHVYRVDSLKQPTDDLALILGDLLHNARGTLDYFVYAEAVWGAAQQGITLSDKEEDRLQFPICLTRNDFNSAVGRGWLLHVRPDTQKLIERLQPYLREKDFRGPFFLAFLGQFSNTDKHRKFNGLLPVAYVRSYHAPQGRDPRQIDTPRSWGEGLKMGDEVVRFVFAEPEPEVDLEVQFECTVGIENMLGPPATVQLDTFLRLIDEQLLGKVTYP
jgi:hypothetical protein